MDTWKSTALIRVLAAAAVVLKITHWEWFDSYFIDCSTMRLCVGLIDRIKATKNKHPLTSIRTVYKYNRMRLFLSPSTIFGIEIQCACYWFQFDVVHLVFFILPLMLMDQMIVKKKKPATITIRESSSTPTSTNVIESVPIVHIKSVPKIFARKLFNALAKRILNSDVCWDLLSVDDYTHTYT